jgi:hypothetical protein
MSLAGTFSTMPLPELLQWLAEARRDGLLALASGLKERYFRLAEGKILALGASEPRPGSLLDLLVGHGFLAEEAVTSDLVEAAASDKIRQMLIDRSLVDRDQIDSVIEDHARDTLLEFFFLEDGRFAFSGADEVATSAWIHWDLCLSSGLGAQDVLMDGMRRIDEWGRIREVFPHDNIVVFALASATGLPAVTALAKEGAPLSVGDLCGRLQAPKFRVIEQLFEGLNAGLVAIEDAPAPISRRGSAVDALLRAATALLDERQFEEASALLTTIRVLDPLEPDTAALLKRARREQLEELYRDLPAALRPVPRPERIAGAELTPEERHIFQRINGRHDIGTLIVLSPLGELHTLTALRRLMRLDLIRLEG